METNGSKSPTWRIIAVVGCFVVFGLLATWGAFVNLQLADLQRGQAVLIVKLQTIQGHNESEDRQIDINTKRLDKIEDKVYR